MDPLLPSNGWANTGIALAILGLVPGLGVPLALAAVVVSAVALRRSRRQGRRQLAGVALTLSIVAVASQPLTIYLALGYLLRGAYPS